MKFKEVRNLIFKHNKQPRMVRGQIKTPSGKEFFAFPLYIYEGRNKVGYVNMVHHTKPADFFEVGLLHIFPEFRGESTPFLSGVGGSTVRRVMEFLNKRHERGQSALAVLVDTTADPETANNKKVIGFYQQLGWKPIPGTFNSYYYSPAPITERQKEDLILHFA